MGESKKDQKGRNSQVRVKAGKERRYVFCKKRAQIGEGQEEDVNVNGKSGVLKRRGRKESGRRGRGRKR